MLKGDLLSRQNAAPDQRVQAYQQALRLRPQLAVAHAALIAMHLARRDLAAARQQLQALQQALPKHPQTLLYEGQLALARERFQTLLRGTPDNLVLLQAAAAVDLQMRAPAQAEALLQKGLQLAPESAATRRLLAHAQLMQGQFAKAVATLDPLLAQGSADTDALQLAAQARLRRAGGAPAAPVGIAPPCTARQTQPTVG